jgi:DNA polymerase-3 subunit epsilon
LYAVLDIETTGGKYNEEGITEIAIYKFDGHEVVDRFVSLINPEREIQPFVVSLTGIDQKMLRRAPKFYEVAKRIVEITEDCVLVAHNANFDYRILTTEFKRIGYDYARKNVCTVTLSRKLLPDQPYYKLGKLCKALGIPVSNRHRAEGDTVATVSLFKLLLLKDKEKEIVKLTINADKNESLAPKLKKILQSLPSSGGVFYFHNDEGEVIYIGKGKRIESEVNRVFLKTSEKEILLQEQTVAVSFDETGSELIAQIVFSEEVMVHKPSFNYLGKKKYAEINFTNPNMVVIDKGREIDEKTILLIQNNELKGYCFTELSNQITDHEVLCNLITPIKNSLKNRFLVKNYLAKSRVEKIIRF